MIMIYKYPLISNNPFEVIRIELPNGALILSVGLDPQDALCIWALVDNTVITKNRVDFWIYGTGRQADTTLRLNFLGTVKDGDFMWHVFTNYSKEGIA